jgi:hypothetical protein
VIVIAVVLSVLAVAAIAVRQIWLNNTVGVVDTAKALDRFRAHTTVPDTTTVATAAAAGTVETAAPVVAAAPAATLPALGVYQYTTSGGEHIDVLGGTGHAYPQLTTITVTADGCGVLLRWDLLEQRREDWRLCLGPDGVTWQPEGGHYYHEFFQHGELQTLVCDRPAVLVPNDHRPRDTVAEHCQLNTAEWLPQWTVLGTETRTVGATSVRVTHVRMVVETGGRYYEHTTVDYWLDDHGLPVHIADTKTSKNYRGIIGDVVYTETITADLVSLSPLR